MSALVAIASREGLIKCSMAGWAFWGDRPSAAKAAYLAGPSGTAEAVPFPKSFGTELSQRFPNTNQPHLTEEQLCLSKVFLNA